MTKQAKFTTVFTLALCAAGCRIGGSTSVDDVTNQLRAENSTLRTQNDDLKQQNAELIAKAATTSATRDAKNTLTAEELQARPRCAQITLDSLSGIVPRTSQVYLYLKTLDGRSRFVQVVGRVTLKISRGSETLIELMLSPSQLREAFRSGLGGTYYLLDCGTRTASELSGAAIDIQFDDALTGTTQTCKAEFDEKGRAATK